MDILNLQGLLKMYDDADREAKKYWDRYCSTTDRLQADVHYDLYLHECARREELARQIVEYVKSTV